MESTKIQLLENIILEQSKSILELEKRVTELEKNSVNAKKLVDGLKGRY